jgi:predicted  nucleic acid-binding Zn ribbon protein
MPLVSPVKLMPALGYNPVHCMDCNLEVPPEALDLPPRVVDELAEWTSVYDAIEQLWLDSGAYERWAGDELADIASPVNARGLAARAKVGEYRSCFYWLFQDESVPNFVPIDRCPRCGGSLHSYGNGVVPQLVCDDCGIVTAGVGSRGKGHGTLPAL